MPWNVDDASGFTKKATSGAAKRMWKSVANSELARTGDEGRAIRTANGVIKKRQPKLSIKTGGK